MRNKARPKIIQRKPDCISKDELVSGHEESLVSATHNA